MGGHTWPKVVAVICIVAAALTASRVGAETPAGQNTTLSDALVYADHCCFRPRERRGILRHPGNSGGIRDAHGNQQRRIHGIKNCTEIVNS